MDGPKGLQHSILQGSTDHCNGKVRRPEERGACFILLQSNPSGILSTTVFSHPNNTIKSIPIITNPKTLSWTLSTTTTITLSLTYLSLAFHQFPPLDANSSQPHLNKSPWHMALSNLTKPLCKASTKRPGVETWEDLFEFQPRMLQHFLGGSMKLQVINLLWHVFCGWTCCWEANMSKSDGGFPHVGDMDCSEKGSYKWNQMNRVNDSARIPF